MSYSNSVYLHDYYSSSIYYFINFFSLVSVGLHFSHFISLLSLLLFSFSLTPRSLSASTGLINLFASLFFSTCFNGSNQPLLFSFTLCWFSSLASISTWMGLINFCSDQPWVSAWMGLGFDFIWVSAPINHENEKQKNHKTWVWEIWVSDLMVVGWWWRWLGLREREAMSEKIIKNIKEWIFYWINV